MVANTNGMPAEVDLEIVSQLKYLREAVRLLGENQRTLVTRLQPILAVPKPQTDNKDQEKISELCPLGSDLRDITKEIYFLNALVAYLLSDLQI